jgi:DNA-binding transcriptional regulator YdaS (Cro superfamily)
LTFQDGQLRLLAYVRERIHNGELTERGFARSIGISQPHAHNVLKGVRKLSPKISDSILKLFHITLVDLASLDELEANLKKRRAQQPVAQLAFLEAPIGPGKPWPAEINWLDRYPLPFRAPTAPEGLAMARLAPDRSMDRTLGDADIGMLDTSGRGRSETSPEGLYAIERAGEVVIRYLRPGATGHYLVTDATMNQPEQWERIIVNRVELLAMVRARVLWLGREDDRELPMDQRGRFLPAISS